MEQIIEIDNTEVDEESARLVRLVVGETHISRIELAAVLARSFQDPGFLPVPVLQAFLTVAQSTARLPAMTIAGRDAGPPSQEREALLELLRDTTWLDALGQRAAAFESQPAHTVVYANDADVTSTSKRMMERFGPLYEKLAK